jgi:hypothetical protein
LRFQRSEGEERQQLKWFALVVSALVVVFILDVLQLPGWGRFVTLCSMILIPVLPGAIAVAILRYRLYDIDRIINQTLEYGTLTAMIAGTYALISLLGAWLGSTVELLDSDLVIAGVTLAVAAAFQPYAEEPRPSSTVASTAPGTTPSEPWSTSPRASEKRSISMPSQAS